MIEEIEEQVVTLGEFIGPLTPLVLPRDPLRSSRSRNRLPCSLSPKLFLHHSISRYMEAISYAEVR